MHGFDLRRLGYARHFAPIKAAEHKTRCGAKCAFAKRHAGRYTQRQIKQHRVRVVTINAAIEVDDLRGHARIDLDNLYAPRLRLIHQLKVKETIAVIDAGEQFFSQRTHAFQHFGGQARRIFKAQEGLRAGIHHLVHNAKDGDFTVVDKTIEIDLHAGHDFFAD